MTRPHARRLALATGALGTLVLVMAGVWWWLVFRQIIFNAYMSVPGALPCMMQESVVCRLAQALCTSDHFLGIRRYNAVTFWIGATLLSVGLGSGLFARGRVQTG